LKIIYGRDEGKRFEFRENDIFLIGREAQGSHAYLKVNSDDEYVSRNHCMIEIRVPYCYLIDNNSRNGTYLKRSGKQSFENIRSHTEIRNGDLIQIGNTIFMVEIVYNHIDPAYCRPLNSEQYMYEKDRLNGSKGIGHCIVCGRHFRKKTPNNTTDQRYGCYYCNYVRYLQQNNMNIIGPNLVKYASMTVSTSDKLKRENLFCCICNSNYIDPDVANKDGRAFELRYVAIYMCKECVNLPSVEIQKSMEIGKYKILKELGRGDMGVAYKSWHKPTQRVVVLKVMIPNNDEIDRLNDLFLREMDVSSKLNHDNILRTIDFSKDKNSLPYLVSEFAPGGDLGNFILDIQKGPLPIEYACNIVIQILNGLEYAHRGNAKIKSIVHRDLKPSNILLSVDHNNRIIAKIGDMGLAKCWEDAGNSRLTLNNEYFGSKFFMSPEQIKKYRFVNPSADIYSVGMILYYLLSCRYPFEYPNPLELKQYEDYGIKGRMLQKYLNEETSKLKSPILMNLEDDRIPLLKQNNKVPNALAEIVDSSILIEPKERGYTTASDLKQSLQLFINKYEN
jgi:serine/threonine protein kinase/pSer/pThr/pTyr-binding forkhead associated (FHA) protein